MKPVLSSARSVSLLQEKPWQRGAWILQLESSPCSLQPEKAHVEQWRLRAVKKQTNRSGKTAPSHSQGSSSLEHFYWERQLWGHGKITTQTSGRPSVLACSGEHNKMPESEKLITTNIYFSQFWRLGSPRSRHRPASGSEQCLEVVTSHGRTHFIRPLSPSWGSALMTVNNVPETPFPNTLP